VISKIRKLGIRIFLPGRYYFEGINGSKYYSDLIFPRLTAVLSHNTSMHHFPIVALRKEYNLIEYHPIP